MIEWKAVVERMRGSRSRIERRGRGGGFMCEGIRYDGVCWRHGMMRLVSVDRLGTPCLPNMLVPVAMRRLVDGS